MDIPVKRAVTRADGAVGFVSLHDTFSIIMPSNKTDSWKTDLARSEISQMNNAMYNDRPRITRLR